MSRPQYLIAIFIRMRNIFSNKDKSILDRMFMEVFWVAIIEEISHVGAEFVDGVITTRALGSQEMAAIGLIYPFFTFMVIISGCLAEGMSNTCIIELGRGHLDKVNRIFNKALWSTILVAVAGIIITLIAIDPIVYIFGARGSAESLFTSSKMYLLGLTIGFLPAMMSDVFALAVHFDNGGRRLWISAVAWAVSNIAFDLIAVWLGMGIFGIGLATSLSYLVKMLVLMRHFTKKGRILNLEWMLPDKEEIVKLLKGGSGTVIRRGLNTARPILMNHLIIAAGGSTAMAVMSVRNSIDGVAEIAAVAVSAGVNMLAGIYYGEVNGSDLKRLGHTAHVWSMVTAIPISILLIALAWPISVFYLGSDSTSLNLMIFTIVAMGVRTLATTLMEARESYLHSTRKRGESHMLMVTMNFITVVACGWLLKIPFGAYGVMASYTVSAFLTILIVYIKYCVMHNTRKPTVEEYMNLSDRFHVKPQDEIDFPIRNAEEATLASEQIDLFARGHGLDNRKGMYAGLCVEELCMNIITYGFKDGEDAQEIDLRLVLAEGDLIIRLRDCCESFSPLDLAQVVDANEAPEANIGIKIVRNMAKEITYFRTVETNHTLIRI